MKKFKLLSLLLIISLFVGALPVHADALSYPDVNAYSVVLMDADSGDVLFEKNGDAAMFPGGLTMLMSALLVAEAIDTQNVALADKVTASENFRYNLLEGSITADPAIVPGEQLSVQDLLYCALLRSAADACNILAEHVGGSVDSFIANMNRRAAELGCTNTYFANANGQMAADGNPPAGHQTTAHDLALIARQLVTKPSVLAVSRAASYTMSATAVSGVRTVYNSNYLLDASSEYYYQQAYGLKTGYSTAIGNCLIAAADWNDMNIIAVVLGCPNNGDQFRDAITLFDWVFANFSYRLILNTTDNLDTIPVDMGSPDSVGVRAETATSLLLSNEKELGNIEYRIQYAHQQEGRDLQAPLNAGQYLGDVTVYMDGEAYGTSRLVAATSVDISRLDYLRTQLETMIHAPAVRQIVTILVVILGIYLLLVLIYFIQRLRHLSSMRRARRDRAISRARQEAQWLEVPEAEEEEPYGYFDQPEYDYEEEDDYVPSHAGDDGYDGE